MNIQLIRIDDRLIHGQVVTSWVNKFEIEQILVIDDVVANDEMQKSILRMTAPANINVQIFGIDKFIKIIQTNDIKKRTMLILRDPLGVLRLFEGGVPIDSLNIGGMRKTPERDIRLTKAVCFSQEEKEAVVELLKRDVEIFVQMIPQDKIEYLNKNEII